MLPSNDVFTSDGASFSPLSYTTEIRTRNDLVAIANATVTHCAINLTEFVTDRPSERPLIKYLLPKLEIEVARIGNSVKNVSLLNKQIED